MTKTQIVILAAGQGRRLLPLTKSLPKTMLKVQEVPIIDHILDSIDINLINEILITVGHSKSVVMNYLKNEYKGIPIKYVDNPKHGETNSLYSLWLAKKFLKEKIAIINADTLFNKKILENLNVYTIIIILINFALFSLKKGNYNENKYGQNIYE